MSNTEIEDVLSSIRRLVSEDDRPAPRSQTAQPGKLVLTAALRVVPPAALAESAPAPFSPRPEVAADLAAHEAAAVLEAALSTQPGEWEPDGSEVAKGSSWAVDWEAPSEPGDAPATLQAAADEPQPGAARAEEQPRATPPDDIWDEFLAEHRSAPMLSARDAEPWQLLAQSEAAAKAGLEGPALSDSEWEAALRAAAASEAEEALRADVAESGDLVVAPEAGEPVTLYAAEDALQDGAHELQEPVHAPDDAAVPAEPLAQPEAVAEDPGDVPHWPQDPLDAPVDAAEHAAFPAEPPPMTEAVSEIPADVPHWPQDPLDEPAGAPQEPEMEWSGAPADIALQTESEGEIVVDEAMLRDLVQDVLRAELHGELGQRITRNVRKLVRAEIARALTARSMD